jgi:hypothetical protein
MAPCQPATIAVPHIISVFEKQINVFKNVGIVAYKSLWLFVDRSCGWLRTVQCGIEISINNC